MLCKAFEGKSDSLTFEIHSGEKVDEMRRKKMGGRGGEASGRNPDPRSDRFIFLVYRGEFDKVTYPLMLAYDEVTDAGELKSVINLLHARQGNQPSLACEFGGPISELISHKSRSAEGDRVGG
jgi:hypothetical protein